MSDWRDHTNEMSTAERAAKAGVDINNARYAGDRSSVDILTEFGHVCANAELERRRVAEERAERLSGRLEVVAAERNALQSDLAAAERERDTALDQLADERKANAKAAREAAYWREDHGAALAAAERERDEARAQRDALLMELKVIENNIAKLRQEAIAAAEDNG